MQTQILYFLSLGYSLLLLVFLTFLLLPKQDPICMKMDEVLYGIAEKVKNFAIIYVVDITEVPGKKSWFSSMFPDVLIPFPAPSCRF